MGEGGLCRYADVEALNWAAPCENVSGRMRTAKAQIILRACAQADQDLHCPVGVGSKECINREQICALCACWKAFFFSLDSAQLVFRAGYI